MKNNWSRCGCSLPPFPPEGRACAENKLDTQQAVQEALAEDTGDPTQTNGR
ncbi:hypothetical protein GCM10011491_24220 [Brucella endophytica]|uniref:Uncharacterized protein n=1 Tax=Brucella endophytica TaxID=1963359 RepID=A0A916WGC1_9HYPH|nr:hypothetical protein GCM10011491_24220 [Brucella endophytica]